MMEIEFWGVRGSIASPGADTARVGGNTSCVEVRCGDARLVFDAGTGLRGLGDRLVREGPAELTLLLSHLHWDHIQGLPFFVPLYLPTTRLAIIGAPGATLSLREAVAQQMQAPVFPVRFEDLPSYVSHRPIRPGTSFGLGEVRVRTAAQNHPGGSMAYRLDLGEQSVVYATDTEHYACVDPALLELCRGVDVLVYDAMYTPEEYSGQAGPARVGWGHSTWCAGVQLARAAGVGQLVLFHHDPARSDEAVGEIEAAARSEFAQTVAAREGLVLTPGRRRGERAA